MVCTILRKSVTGSLSVLIMVRESVQRSRLRRVIILTSLLQMLERTGNYEKFTDTLVADTVGLAEYFPEENTLVVLDEPNRLKE